MSTLSMLHFSEEFCPVFKQLMTLPSGSLGETLENQTEIATVELPKKFSRYAFETTELLLLSQLYSRIHTNTPNFSTTTLHLNSVFPKYTSVTIGGKKSCATTNPKNPSAYLAKWSESLFGNCPDQDSSCLYYLPSRINL